MFSLLENFLWVTMVNEAFYNIYSYSRSFYVQFISVLWYHTVYFYIDIRVLSSELRIVLY